MNRISQFFLVFLGALALSACQRTGLYSAEYNPSTYGYSAIQCTNLKAQVQNVVANLSYCRVDSDCDYSQSLADSCGGVVVNAQYVSQPALLQAIQNYNNACRPQSQTMCPMIYTYPSCQNNRCYNRF